MGIRPGSNGAVHYFVMLTFGLNKKQHDFRSGSVNADDVIIVMSFGILFCATERGYYMKQGTMTILAPGH